jgi:hypothetical protein
MDLSVLYPSRGAITPVVRSMPLAFHSESFEIRAADIDKSVRRQRRAAAMAVAGAQRTASRASARPRGQMPRSNPSRRAISPILTSTPLAFHRKSLKIRTAETKHGSIPQRQGAAQPQVRVGRDTAPARKALPDVLRGYANFLREPVLARTERYQKLLLQHVTGGYGFVSDSPRSRHRERRRTCEN